MATDVEIANMALLECGAEAITALLDGNERARACNTSWPFVRRMVLAMHPWNYPTKRALVDSDATTPLWDYETRYPIPTDCLRVLEVDTTADWRVEGQFIVTDESGDDLGIRYVYDEEDPDHFGPMLTDVLVLGMAYRIMTRVTGDKGLRDRIERQWVAWSEKCKNLDGQEQSDVDQAEDSWLTSRY